LLKQSPKLFLRNFPSAELLKMWVRKLCIQKSVAALFEARHKVYQRHLARVGLQREHAFAKKSTTN
jgi:hypothetical protein